MSGKQTGSCLCGGFKYELKTPAKLLMNCHCGMCRKATGAVFWSFFVVRKEDLVFLAKSTITAYKSSATGTRYFCNRCGCSAYMDDANVPRSFCLSAGTFDGNPGIDVTGEAYVKYKAPWHQLYAGVPNSDEGDIYVELGNKI